VPLDKGSSKKAIFNYLWPHVDSGISQMCAKFIFGDDMYKYNHGHLFDNGDIFRITDKDYDKEWLRTNMSALKEEWKRRQENAIRPR